MNDFSLSRKAEKNFPTSIEGVRINADFRNILRILRMLKDDEILEIHKPALVVKWFYEGAVQEDIPENAVELFVDFVGGNMVRNGGDEPPQYDYEFDAKEIYQSFLKEYSLDLLDIDFLHFHKFRILLAGLSEESSFIAKIRLRFKDLSGFKGQDLTDLTLAKERVQLPERLSKEDIEFQRVWGEI